MVAAYRPELQEDLVLMNDIGFHGFANEEDEGIYVRLLDYVEMERVIQDYEDDLEDHRAALDNARDERDEVKEQLGQAEATIDMLNRRIAELEAE